MKSNKNDKAPYDVVAEHQSGVVLGYDWDGTVPHAARLVWGGSVFAIGTLLAAELSDALAILHGPRPDGGPGHSGCDRQYLVLIAGQSEIVDEIRQAQQLFSRPESATPTTKVSAETIAKAMLVKRAGAIPIPRIAVPILSPSELRRRFPHMVPFGDVKGGRVLRMPKELIPQHLRAANPVPFEVHKHIEEHGGPTAPSLGDLHRDA